jgi:asparagine synthase (glutamine-hydrolysing)
MCGICGQYNFGDSTPVQRRTIEAMTKAIIHRGPDDEGYHIAGPLGLGFRRLSIIDLSGGHQPMSDQDESVWVVFNGESTASLSWKVEGTVTFSVRVLTRK